MSRLITYTLTHVVPRINRQTNERTIRISIRPYVQPGFDAISVVTQFHYIKFTVEPQSLHTVRRRRRAHLLRPRKCVKRTQFNLFSGHIIDDVDGTSLLGPHIHG